MSWLLNFAYGLLVLVVSPVLLYRVMVLGKYRAGWGEKFLGRLPLRASRNYCVWFHAVSVGEVLQLQTVVKELKRAQPDWEIWITTTTHTGHAVAREKFPGETVCYFPLDFSWAVRNAIRRVRPSMIVLVELELWPNFIRESHRSNVPLALINGRISERSFTGYRRIRFLMRSLLSKFDRLAVQSETYGDRLIQLGAPPERVTVTGSIKFDGVRPDRNNPQTNELRRSFEISDEERIVIIGSTQDPEEAYALDAYQSLKAEFPLLRLILVPRHKERFEEVARLVVDRGCSLLRRSALKEEGERGRRGEGEIQKPEARGQGSRNAKDKGQRTKDQPVLLLDTLGELSACWGLAEIAFVGGSLTNRGGQNMLEPSGYGAGVLFGPNTRNFRDVVELLLSHDAAKVVANADELSSAIRHWLLHPEEAAGYGQRAQKLVLSQQGATRKTVELLEAIAWNQPSQKKSKAA
jgi:3-deoxy-D-manno-octulosonic-acid transferase